MMKLSEGYYLSISGRENLIWVPTKMEPWMNLKTGKVELFPRQGETAVHRPPTPKTD
jgi:hypothetical protein